MELRHRDYLGMYAAALVANVFIIAVGGLLISREAAMIIFKAACFACFAVALMIILIIGIVEGVQFAWNGLASAIGARCWPRLHSAALDASSD